MYSIKPGRSQSLFGAFTGVIFIVVLIVMMGGMKAAGAPSGMLLVPVLMIVLVVGGIGLSVYNAFATNRTSHLDITMPGEESDPLDPALRRPLSRADAPPAFCSACGSPLDADDNFCPHCGMAIDR